MVQRSPEGNRPIPRPPPFVLIFAGKRKEHPLATWIAQYVYLEKDGNTGVTTARITADSREEAMEKAAKSATAADFTLSVYLESSDQHLGAIRHRAMEMTGRAVIADTEGWNEEDEEDDLENGETGETGLRETEE